MGRGDTRWYGLTAANQTLTVQECVRTVGTRSMSSSAISSQSRGSARALRSQRSTRRTTWRSCVATATGRWTTGYLSRFRGKSCRSPKDRIPTSEVGDGCSSQPDSVSCAAQVEIPAWAHTPCQPGATPGAANQRSDPRWPRTRFIRGQSEFDSRRCDHLGVAQQAERVLGEHEAAGAEPATQTSGL